MQVAWRHVVTLTPGGSLAEAARLMALHGVGSVVVVDASGVCGIVTREDLARANDRLEHLLLPARCASCGARRHLRPASDGQCICQTCQAAANSGN
jgi:CBS-domain-containing membrane protein